MKESSKIISVVLFFALLLSIVGNVVVLKEIKTQKESNTVIESKLQKSKESLASTKNDLDVLSQRYQTLYKEKNGSANDKLIKASHELFKTIYNYDTSTAKGTVHKRKEEASKLCSEDVLDSLFPNDAQDTVPSIDLISSLSGEPGVYMKSSNSNILQAIILVKNSVKIADVESDQSGSYLYKVTYDQFKNQFTSIERLGEKLD